QAIAIVTRVSGEDRWQLSRYRLQLAHIELLDTKKRLGADHPDYVAGLSRLANQYREQSHWEAESLYREALGLRKKLRQEESLENANLLNGLGALYQRQAQELADSLRFRRRYPLKPPAGVAMPEKQIQAAAAAAKQEFTRAIDIFTKAQGA